MNLAFGPRAMFVESTSWCSGGFTAQFWLNIQCLPKRVKSRMVECKKAESNNSTLIKGCQA